MVLGSSWLNGISSEVFSLPLFFGRDCGESASFLLKCLVELISKAIWNYCFPFFFCEVVSYWFCFFIRYRLMRMICFSLCKLLFFVFQGWSISSKLSDLWVAERTCSKYPLIVLPVLVGPVPMAPLSLLRVAVSVFSPLPDFQLLTG